MAAATSPAEHLCVLVHGLWGNPVHLDFLRQTLEAQYPDGRLHVLVAKSNSDSFTYDGIEVGGERIADEIEQKIKQLEQLHGRKPASISITGYSLGGLVARYAIGLLYSAGVFEQVRPVNFTTFATPHLGVRTPKLGYRAYAWNVLGSRTLSSSGQQIFLVDDFRASGRPLLSILADPKGIFWKGLRLFEKKSLYANTMNDRSVPYYTACITRTDPYADIERVDVHYLPGQDDPVLLDPANPVTPRPPPNRELTIYERYLPTQQTLSSVPFYAVLISLMPIAVPTFLANSVYQSYRSAQRVRLHEQGQAGISRERYRIPLLEEVQAVQDRVYERLVEKQGEDYLPTPPPEPDAERSPASSRPTSSRGEREYDSQDESRRQGSAKNDSPFPTLALTAEQFDMIDHMDELGFIKYAAHIQRHRHTHAAIVVRMPKDGFAEGKAVVRHWAATFKV